MGEFYNKWYTESKMKIIVRIFVVEFFGLYLANSVAKGLVFQNELQGFIITAGALAVATRLIRPIINILLLPLTLATLGLLKFLSHTVTLYLVDVALNQFSVEYFDFPGLKSQYLDLPAVHFNHGVMAYLAFSILISFVTGFVNWLMKH